MQNRRYSSRTLDRPELGTVLAALRFYQENRERLPENIMMIATDSDEFPAMTNSQIDDLCELLNQGNPRLGLRVGTALRDES